MCAAFKKFSLMGLIIWCRQVIKQLRNLFLMLTALFQLICHKFHKIIRSFFLLDILLLLLLFFLKRLQVGENCIFEISISSSVEHEIFLDVLDLVLVPTLQKFLTKQTLFTNFAKNSWQEFAEILILVLYKVKILYILEGFKLGIGLNKSKSQHKYFFMRFRQSLPCQATCLLMLTLKKTLKRVQAIRGFLRPIGFILDTIFAEAMSKSSFFSSYFFILMYSPNLSSYSLPKSMIPASKETTSSTSSSSSSFSSSFSTALSSFLFFFLPLPFPVIIAGFSQTLTTLPLAIFLRGGGFFMMKAASLCLLSRSPTKGQESHLPRILSPATCICISGNLHLGQHIYLSMNLSRTFLKSSSLKSPLMMQLVLFLPPAYLKVVWEAFSFPNHFKMYSAFVLR